MKSEYVVSVIPLTERSAKIEHERNLATRTHRFYDYRTESIDLPVIRLSIDTPIYRTANYRTNLLHLRWIREKKLNSDFFSSGEENESVQRVQHDFLWDLAQTEKESLKSIVEILEDEKQREPILITGNGVVVNGNRRLAAMRELKFSHVDCMILPLSANEDDLKDIEVRLQMTPETRLPYGWINECLAIDDLKNRGRKIEKIAELMRLDPPRVKDKLQMLTEVNLYLSEWKDTKGEADYEILNDAEEIISQITKRISKKDGVNKEVSRHIAWILLDQRGNDGRIYDLRDTTGNLTQSVVDKMQEVYSSEMATEAPNANDDLEFELEESTQNSEQALISFLKTFKDNDQKQQDIVNICRVVVEAKKNKDTAGAALKSVKDAHTKLVEVDLTTADAGTYLPIKKQLDEIDRRVQFLRSEIERYEAKGN